MSCDNKKHSAMFHVVRLTATLLFACAALLGAPAAFAVDSGDIIVVSSKGEVHITMNGAERKVRAGGVLELPAQVRTGRDGNVELRQGTTTVSVGPETLLEFPALEKRGAPIDRIVQPRGNAFYNIGKRDGRKLRVETPYLVGVIKGTQFNVASQDEATTISLFEGLLEVRATDDSDVVDLKAGEIASRKRGDKSISIIRMDAGKAPPTSSRPSPGNGSNSGAPRPTTPRVPPANPGDEPLVADHRPIDVRPDVGLNVDARTGGSSVDTGVAATVGVGQGLDATTSVGVNAASSGVNVGADTSVGLGNTVDVAANAAVNVGPAGADVVTNIGVDAGPVTADVGVTAAVDAAAGTVDVNTGVGLDAGPVTADLGVTAAVDAAAGTVDVSTGVGVDTGPVTADLGASTSVDLGAGTIDTSVSTSVDAGPLTTDVAAGAAVDLTSVAVDTAVDVGVVTPVADVDLGATAAVDLTSPTVDTAVDVGVVTPVVDVDLGASAVVDVGAGAIDLGVDVAGADIDLGVSVADTVDVVVPVVETVTDTVVDVGGLLDGLLRRPGRR